MVQGYSERPGRGLLKKKDSGASLVEFALIAPLLFLLLFGVIEFAWVFSQNLDVRHGAREGARLAAVNYDVGPLPSAPARSSTQTSTIVAEVCSRMDVASDVTVTLTSDGDVGDPAIATVNAPADTLTGFLDWALPDTLVLGSTVEIRMEQFAGWANTTAEACP